MPIEKKAALVLAALLALGAGLYFGSNTRPSAPAADAESRLAALGLRDLSGQARRISDWPDKPLILNFWATWCAPCIEEMPLLDRWQKTHGDQVQVLAIALDSAENVAKFRDRAGIRLPLLIADAELLDLMKSLGNPAGGLPFSLFLDRQGHIVGQHLGALDEQMLQDRLALLQQ